MYRAWAFQFYSPETQDGCYPVGEVQVTNLFLEGKNEKSNKPREATCRALYLCVRALKTIHVPTITIGTYCDRNDDG